MLLIWLIKYLGVSVGKVDEVKLNRLATGGVIDKPTIAMVGEAGKEVVMPLERNTGWIDQLAEKLNSKGGNEQPIQLIVKVGDDTLLNKILNGVKNKNFASNGEVFSL